MLEGTVTSLLRYPVKSMLGEALDRASIGADGIDGDRRHAFVDTESGKIASAKLPHRWQKLLGYAARADARDGAVWVTTPAGQRLLVTDPALEVAVSADTGRTVRLVSHRAAGLLLDRADPDAVVRHGHAADVDAITIEMGAAAPHGGFFDFAPIHLITTVSLAAIAGLTKSGEADVARFRPNIVVDLPGVAAFAENDWAGRILTIGDVRLQMLIATPRCAIPTLAHGALPRDVRLTQAIGKANSADVPGMGHLACLGAYATVLATGVAGVGDRAGLSG